MATFNTLTETLDSMGLDYNEEYFGYANGIEYGQEWVSKTGKTIYRCLSGFYHVNNDFLTTEARVICEELEEKAFNEELAAM